MNVLIGQQNTPYINAYRWNAGFGTKFADPSVSLPGRVYNARFTRDGNAVIIIHTGSPYLSAYEWDETTGFGTKYANSSDTTTQYTGGRLRLGFNDDYMVMVKGISSTSGVHGFQWDTSTGFGTKYTAPSPQPDTSDCNDIAIARDDSAVIVAHSEGSTQGILVTAYAFDKTTGFGTKYADPSSAFAAGTTGSAVTFTTNVDAVLVRTSGSPYIHAYEWDSATGFGTKYSDPSSAASNTSSGEILSSSNDDFVICNTSYHGPEVFPWDSSTGFGTKYAEPSGEEPIIGYCLDLTPNESVIAIGGSSILTDERVEAYEFDKTTGSFGSFYSIESNPPTGSVYSVHFSFTPMFTERTVNASVCIKKLGVERETTSKIDIFKEQEEEINSIVDIFKEKEATITSSCDIKVGGSTKTISAKTSILKINIGQVDSKIRLLHSYNYDVDAKIRLYHVVEESISAKISIFKETKLERRSHYIGEKTGYIHINPAEHTSTYYPSAATDTNQWLYLEDHFTTPHTKFAFDCILETGATSVSVRLYNLTDDAEVTDSEITVTASGQYETDFIDLTGAKEYVAQATFTSGGQTGDAYIVKPRVIIVQEENFIQKSEFFYPLASNGLTFSNSTWTTIWPNKEGAFIYTHDASKFNGDVTFYVETNFYATSGNTNYIRLFDVTGNLAVIGSDISTAASASRTRSSGFTLEDGRMYAIQMRTENPADVDVCGDIRLIVYQDASSDTRITETLDFIDLRTTYEESESDQTSWSNVENDVFSSYPYGTKIDNENYLAYTRALKPIGSFVLDDTYGAVGDSIHFRHYDETSSSAISDTVSEDDIQEKNVSYLFEGGTQYYFDTSVNQEIYLQSYTETDDAPTLARLYNFGIFAEIFYKIRENAIKSKARIAHSDSALESFSNTTRNIGCRIEIMWDGHAWTDESTRFISARGNSQYSGKNGELVSDECDFELENIGERFSPDNDNSAIQRYLKPNVQVRFAIGINGYYTTVFTGFIKSIEPDITGGFVNIHCFDSSTIILDKVPPTEIYTSKYYHEIVDILGVSAGVDETKIEAEESTAIAEAVFFDEDRTVDEILSEIAIAERGRIFFDRSGNLTFWNKYHYQDQQPVFVLTQEDWIMNMQKGISEEDIRNKTTVTAKPRKPDGIQVVWSNEDAVASNQYDTELVWIPARSYQNAFIELEDPAIQWQTPLPYVDYVANSEKDGTLSPSNPSGTGTDLTENIVVENFVTYKQSAFLKVTNIGYVDAYLTEFSIRANPLKVYKWIKKQYTDTDSITKYGVKEFSLENNWIYSDEAAQSIALYEVSANKNIKKSYSASIIGVPVITSGELVTVETRKNKYTKFHVSNIDWTVDQDSGYTQNIDIVENIAETVDFLTTQGVGTGVIAESIIGASATKRGLYATITSKTSIKDNKYGRIRAMVNIVT